MTIKMFVILIQIIPSVAAEFEEIFLIHNQIPKIKLQIFTKNDEDFDLDADYSGCCCRVWANVFFHTWKTLQIEIQILTKNDNDKDFDFDADYSECCCRVWRNIFLYINKY